MRVAIIGAGAMGSLWGAKLSPFADVWLIDRWGEHVTIMQQQGIRLIEPDGREQIMPVQATQDPSEIDGTVDLAIIFVKSPGTAKASQRAKTLLKRNGLALSMQNGLGNAEIMATILGEDRVIQGVTSHGATLVGPGYIRHAGGGVSHLAVRPSIARQIVAVGTLFQQAGFEIDYAAKLDSLLWGKLIINVGINALTAILRVPNGLLAEITPASKIVLAAVEEAVRIAKAKEIVLPYDDPVAQVWQVSKATGSNRSSMLSDVVRAVSTEIDVINGAIVREGKRLGLDTPINQMLVWLVQAIEATYEIRD